MSTACQYLKSPRSLSHRSLHLAFQGYGQGQPDAHIWGLKFNQYVYFLFRGNWIILGWDQANSNLGQYIYLTLKIQGQSYGQGQTRWSYFRPRVQSISLLFVSWQSHIFWLRYIEFNIWPWTVWYKTKFGSQNFWYFQKYVHYESNNNVVKHYGSMIPHDWDVSFEKFRQLSTVVSFWEN